MSTPNYALPPAGLGSLTIGRIETIPIRVPLVRAYAGSHYRMTHRSTIVTRVHMEEGITGEAYCGDEDAQLLEIDSIIRAEIAPKLVGEDAYAIEKVWQLARPATFDILRDRRLGLGATACIDTAIWDAIGKACGHPLWRLWGGFRRRLQVISIGGYYGTGVPISEEIADFRERGLAGMKFKVGGRSPEEDAERFREARAAAGDAFILCADANQAWTTREAISFARLVRDLDVRWFEEPCRWSNDRRCMRDVRYTGGLPICAGQTELSAGGCRDLLVDGAIDVCNFDASWSGGPTEWRRVAAMALVFDCEMAHHEEPQVASHLLASVSNGTYLEVFHPDRDPIWWNLVTNRPTLRDGWVELSDAPGLGWELDLDYVERYRVR
jgi:L-alanine-DL-glutamate epimerase-like enolase superfamily enzyme